MFSVCSHLGGGGTPARSDGGYPPRQTWGYPSGGPHLSYPPGRTWWGVPDGGTPPWVPLIRPGCGVPDRGYPTSGTPHQTWAGGYPNQGGYPTSYRIQMEYLICHGRYTSCVHAGGLSCLEYVRACVRVLT